MDDIDAEVVRRWNRQGWGGGLPIAVLFLIFGVVMAVAHLFGLREQDPSLAFGAVLFLVSGMVLLVVTRKVMRATDRSRIPEGDAAIEQEVRRRVQRGNAWGLQVRSGVGFVLLVIAMIVMSVWDFQRLKEYIASAGMCALVTLVVHLWARWRFYRARPRTTETGITE